MKPLDWFMLVCAYDKFKCNALKNEKIIVKN